MKEVHILFNIYQMIHTSTDAFNFYKKLIKGAHIDCHEEHCSIPHDHSKERILYERSIEEKYKCCQRFVTGRVNTTELRRCVPHLLLQSTNSFLFIRDYDILYSLIYSLREQGNAAYDRGDYRLASTMYQKIFIQLDYSFPETDEWKRKFEEITLKTHLNMALVKYKLREYQESIYNCNHALKIDSHNVKAINRRALSHIMLSQLDAARKDFELLLSLGIDQNTINAHMKKLDELAQQDERKERLLYKSMFR